MVTRRRAAALGALVGLSSVAAVFVAECYATFGSLGDARLRFIERIAAIPAAVLTSLAGELFVQVVSVYALVAVAVAVWLAVFNALVGAGRSWRWILVADLAVLAWVYLAGQLRLAAVHPYARDDAFFEWMAPALRSFWSLSWANAVALVLGGLIVWRVARGRTQRLQVSFALLAFAPLLGHGLRKVDTDADRSYVSQAPAVILIGVDSMRADYLGRGITPNLDAFFEDAFVFREARTPIARTHPSWVSMLTAASPDIHGVRYNRAHPQYADALEETLPGRLLAAGYHTRFLTDDNMFSDLTSAHGFAQVDQPPPAIQTYATKPWMKLWAMTVLPARWVGHLVPTLVANRALYHNYDAGDFTTRLIDALDEEAQRQGPFFLAAHLCTIHFPGTQPAPGFREHQPEDPALGYFKVSLASLARGDSRATEAQQERLTGLYAAGVANADAQLGDVFTYLRSSGLWDRAWVIVWSDHGESFSDHEHRPLLPNHGLFIDNDDQDLRIAMAIKGPKGHPVRGETRQLVRSLDIAPTLLDYLALPAFSSPHEGVSLRPLIEGGTLPELVHYAETELQFGRRPREGEATYSFHPSQTYEYLPHYGDITVRRRFHDEIVRGKHRALRIGRWKVTYHPVGTGGEWHLWDATGAESGDLREKYPTVFAGLRAELQTRIDKDLSRPPTVVPEAAVALAPPWWPWSASP